MVILDLHETKRLSVEIIGSENEFYRTLDFVKGLPNAEYKDEDKVWLLPRDKSIINKLEDEFDVAYKKDRATLLGEDKPYVKTGADDLIERYGSVDDFMNYFNNDITYDMLYDFQKLGVASALYHLSEDGGFLIGDDMGAGKTAEALGVITALKSINEVGRVLIICPKNVIYQWGREVEKFTNLDYVIVDGYCKEKRLECYDENVDIYIINDDLLILDDDYDNLSLLNFDLLVADEIHCFKNRDTQRTQAVKELAENIDYKLGLTGTPLQNRPEDTFSIFELLVPGYLGDWSSFSNRHICWRYINGNPRPVGYKNLRKINEKVARKMIRRESEDIADDLPNVHHKNHYVDMTPLQEELSQHIRAQIDKAKDEVSSSDLDDDELEEKDELIMGLKNVLIMVSDDPRLLNDSSSQWINNLADISEQHTPNKIIKLKELVDNILGYSEDFQIVIFSKFLKMVLRIEQALNELDSVNDMVLIHGDINNKQRNQNVEKFRHEDNCRILISSDAGAEGLDLQIASHLINYDLPWSPAKLDQRNGRIRRIGSPHDDVYVSNILTEGSIDERIEDIIREKREIYDIIISNTGDQKKALKKFVRENVA